MNGKPEAFAWSVAWAASGRDRKQQTGDSWAFFLNNYTCSGDFCRHCSSFVCVRERERGRVCVYVVGAGVGVQ